MIHSFTPKGTRELVRRSVHHRGCQIYRKFPFLRSAFRRRDPQPIRDFGSPGMSRLECIGHQGIVEGSPILIEIEVDLHHNPNCNRSAILRTWAKSVAFYCLQRLRIQRGIETTKNFRLERHSMRIDDHRDQARLLELRSPPRACYFDLQRVNGDGRSHTTSDSPWVRGFGIYSRIQGSISCKNSFFWRVRHRREFLFRR